MSLNINELDTIAKFKRHLMEYDIYLSNRDLEYDLIDSQLHSVLYDFYKEENDEDIIKAMQNSKATSMFNFLSVNQGKMSVLKDSYIADPLWRCKEYAEGLYNDSI